jgi:hypothetical protein
VTSSNPPCRIARRRGVQSIGTPSKRVLADILAKHAYNISGMTMRRRRLRLTIAGIMGIVALTAIVLGCLVEAVRIRRTQAFYLRESAKYAQLEKSENQMQSAYLTLTGSTKKLIEHMKDIESDNFVADHFFVPSPVGAYTELYKIEFERGRKYLAALGAARTNAKRYSELSRRYKRAGTCLWLPFGPNPLSGGD